MGKFKKGFVLGGLLGLGLMWMNTTKKGKEMRKNLLGGSEKIYGLIKEKVVSSGMADSISKHEYTKMVKQYVDKFAVEYKWAGKAKDRATKVLTSQWKNLQTELKGGKK